MRRIIGLLFVVLLFSNFCTGQATYTWVGGIAGDYQVSTNWSPARTSLVTTDILAFNASAATTVNNVPNQTIGAIKILSGTSAVYFATNSSANSLKLSAAVPLDFTTAGSVLSADFLTISLNNPTPFSLSSGRFGIAAGTGGKITINGELIIAGGTLDIDVLGTGGTLVGGTGVITYTSGTFNCATVSALTWASGANYYHNVSGTSASVIPASTWSTGSTCNITGMNAGSIAPTGLSNATNLFANFAWDCSSQFANVDMLPAGTSMSVNQTFYLKSTGTKELRFSAAGKAAVNANAYTQTAGTLTLQASAAVDTTTLGIAGIFSQTGGTLNGVGAASPGLGILDLKGGVTKASGTTWQSSSSSNASQFIVQFSGSTAQTISIAGSWSAPAAGRCNIVNSNLDRVNGITLTGTLKVVNTGSSSLPATCTMNGVITGGGAITYTGAGSAGTSLIYTGNFLQTASAIEYPVTNGPLHLTLSNTLGLTFPANFNRTVAGTLNMITGNLELGTDTLSLTNSTLGSQLAYSGGYITTGTLARSFPTTGLPTDTSNTRSLFPFGAGNNNRSLRLYFSSAILSGATAGMIYVTHSPVVGVVAISPTLADNGINLDKRTMTNWKVSTAAGGFDLGSSGQTISLSVVAGNIGAVDDHTKLRLTDGSTSYGSLINTNTGTKEVPATGKSRLQMSDLSKPIYIGSDGTNVYNPLIIITFTWTGLGGNTDWTNAGNWTGIGAVGYPSASTEIAIITSTSGTQPTIKTSDNISLYQLTVGGGMKLTMAGNAVINVYDNVNFTGGLTDFAYTSTFGYASSSNSQNVLDLAYGSLSISGTVSKILAPSITVTGNYTVTGYGPTIGTGTFTYAYAGGNYTQKVAATSYYNLTITGNRNGSTIALGTLTLPTNTISVSHDFVVTATNYVGRSDYNTVDFTSSSSQPIPGFIYNTLKNSGNGPRVYDPLGSTNPLNVISAASFTPSSLVGGTTVTGSKVKFVFAGNGIIFGGTTNVFNDLEISGAMTGFTLNFTGNFSIAGVFSVTATGFTQGTGTSTFIFNGSGNQTIPATYPGFSFNNVSITGINRKITFEPSGSKSVGITGALTVAPGFAAPNGFITAGSTVHFSVGTSTIPVLVPSAGTSNYNNISINGGVHNFGGNLIVGGNLSVTGTDASPGVLNVGDGITSRTLTVLGNLSVSGTGSGAIATGQVDMYTLTNGSTRINLGGNLTISGNGQLMGTTNAVSKGNGLVVFNGTAPQTYSNSSTTFKNGIVNFTVGNGTTASYLTLGSVMSLLASSGSSNRDTLTVATNSSLDCSTYNISSYGSGNAAFNLNAGATFLTANTGGVEGTATNSGNGSIVNNATIVRSYSVLASYVFNASSSTNTNFPAVTTPFPMANLTVGDNISSATYSLNKSIDVSNSLTLRDFSTLGISNSYLSLKSTVSNTARIAPVPDNANITYGSGRFVIERYYPSRRAWRLVTAPVTADPSNTVFNSWQMGGQSSVGSGTFVTGPGADPAANGLDISPQNNFSLKIFDKVTGAQVGVSNTKTQLISGTDGIGGTPDNIGMFLFVRGDRSTTNLFNIPFSNITTLRDTGKAQIHGQSFKLDGAAGGFSAVGNPYASPVDISSLVRGTANVNPDLFWVFDPYVNSEQGGWITMSWNGSGWTATPASPGGLTKDIQSSQGFFVQKNSAAQASMNFTEPLKSTSYTPGVFRPLAGPARFETTLYLKGADSLTIADGTLVAFDGSYNSEVDFSDALKFGNTKETFYMMRDTKALSVEKRQPVTASDTIFFKLSKTTQRNYQFKFVPSNMDELLTAYLEDSYTGIRTALSLSSVNTFDFDVNGDAKSAASDRFRIVFKKADNTILPVTFSNIQAFEKDKDIAVQWTVENELNVLKYIVEKSTDGVNFNKVATFLAKGANSATSLYEMLDINPLPGNNFYRIQSISQGGSTEYSTVVLVKTGKKLAGITIYPNPVKDNTIGVAFNNVEKGVYGLKLINTLGQTMMIDKINIPSGSSAEIIRPRTSLAPGIYQLEVSSPGRKIHTIKVIVQ